MSISDRPRQGIWLLTPTRAEYQAARRGWAQLPPALRATTQVVQIGVGARAGATVTHRLQSGQPELAVLVGYAGGLVPALPTGSLLLGTSIVDRSGQPLVDLTGQALAARLGLPAGPIAAVDSIVTEPWQKQALHATSGAWVAEMEGSHVAASCAAQGVPLVVLRAVTDDCWTTLPAEMLSLVTAAGDLHLGRLLTMLCCRPYRLAALLRLGSAAAQADRALRTELPRLVATLAEVLPSK